MKLEIVANAGIRMMLFGTVAWLIIRAVRLRNPHVEVLVWRMVLLASLALPALLYWRVAPDFSTPFRLPVLSPGDAGAPPTPSGSSPALPAVATIYFAGVLLLVTRLALGLAVMWRISRAAEPFPTPGDVRISARVHSPATFGTVVLLPVEARTWPAERLDAVLDHERAHVRARDGYWSWLAQLHAALFWFSPLAWWLQRRLELLAETTSDDAVVVARHDPVAYAALLLDFARNPNNRSVAMSVAESNVSKRIERLLARTPPARELPRIARWAAVAMLVPAVVLAASTTRAAPLAKSAASTEAPHVAARGLGIAHPANPDDYYPEIAKQEHVTGFAVLEVDLDSLGQLVDARVVNVQPADPRFGFADAALQVARNTEYVNPQRRASSFRFMVKFALTDK